MKITSFFLLLITLNVNAQNDYNIAIAARKQNVLYYGVPNPLSIAVSGVKVEEMEIFASDSSKIIYNDSQKEFNILPKSKSGLITIEIFSKNKSETIHYGSKIFRIKTLPTSTPFVLNNPSYTNNISIDSIALIRQLKLEEINLDFAIKIRPKEFYLDIQGMIYYSNSENLTVEMQAALLSIKKGDKIKFERIQAYFPDGSIRFINDLPIEFY